VGGIRSCLAIICPVIRNNCVDDVSVSDGKRKRGEQLRAFFNISMVSFWCVILELIGCQNSAFRKYI